MKIRTHVFAITLRAGYLYVRVGSRDHGLEAKAARLGSYVRLNWGIASYSHIFRNGLACYFLK